MQETRTRVLILGSGPAGLTAALYTARAQLEPIVLDGDTPGGQLTTTSEIENYPGFPQGIDGNAFVDQLNRQAARFGARFQPGHVQRIERCAGTGVLRATTSDARVYIADAMIVATGARPRKLGLPSEDVYWARGVTSCATCDGFFYKGRTVCVVGGGDSAMEEALFLTRFCPKIHLLHRRDRLRASRIMAERALVHPNIEVHYNVGVAEILGDMSRPGGLKVTGVRLHDTTTSEESVLEVEGVFLAIGHIPNTDFLRDVVDLDADGYVVAEPRTTRTRVPGLFVAGDAQDRVYRQAITAAGTGCMAAIDAERYLESIQK